MDGKMSGGGGEMVDNWEGHMGVDRGEKGCECVQDLSSQSGNDPDTVLKRDLVMRDNDVDVRDGEEETFFSVDLVLQNHL